MAKELSAVLQSLSLKAVYWIDDDNTSTADMDAEKLLGAVSVNIRRGGSKSIKNAIGKMPQAWRPELKKLQDQLEQDEAVDVEERPDRADQIERKLRDLSDKSENPTVDLSVLLQLLDGKLSKAEKAALTSLFAPLAERVGYAWKPLSFTEWENQSKAILSRHTASRPALVLLDQQNTHDKSPLDGDEILRSICSDPRHSAAFKFLVVTNTCLPDEELDHAVQLAKKVELGVLGIRSPLFAMSKSRITRSSEEETSLESHFVSLLRRLKLSLLNQELASLARKVVQEATDRAFNRLTEITLHEFMYAVTQSSQIEGVSELDTLLRLVSIEQRSALLKYVTKSKPMRRALENIRSIPVEIREKELIKNADLVGLRSREIYWPERAVNELHQPLGAGDIFATRKRKGKVDYYVLLANDCDLMLRSDGLRNATVALLAKLEEDGGNNDTDVSLECPLPQDRRLVRVPLNKFLSAPTDLLDLCWTNSKGACVWANSVDHSQLAILQSQRSRLRILRRRFETESSLIRIVGSSPLPLRRIPGVGDRVDFGLRRVGRMNTPYAQGILSKFAGVFARPSYDHDYANIRQAGSVHAGATKVPVGKKAMPGKKPPNR